MNNRQLFIAKANLRNAYNSYAESGRVEFLLMAVGNLIRFCEDNFVTQKTLYTVQNKCNGEGAYLMHQGAYLMYQGEMIAHSVLGDPTPSETLQKIADELNKHL